MPTSSIFRVCAALMIFAAACPVRAFAMGRFFPAAPRRAIAEKAPDFILRDLQGKTFRLSDQRGKPVLLVFSTTWCPSCRAEIPHLKSIHAAYAAKGLQMVNIDIQEKREKVAPYAARHRLPYRTLLDPAGDVAAAYGVRGIPNLVLVDRQGIIVCSQCASPEGLLKTLFAKP